MNYNWSPSTNEIMFESLFGLLAGNTNIYSDSETSLSLNLFGRGVLSNIIIWIPILLCSQIFLLLEEKNIFLASIVALITFYLTNIFFMRLLFGIGTISNNFSYHINDTEITFTAKNVLHKGGVQKVKFNDITKVQIDQNKVVNLFSKYIYLFQKTSPKIIIEFNDKKNKPGKMELVSLPKDKFQEIHDFILSTIKKM